MSGFLPGPYLSCDRLRRHFRLLTAPGRVFLLTLLLGGSACSRPQPEQLAALRAGREAATPCQERFHEESQTYADCVRYVARSKASGASGGTPQHDWFRLGALYTGWVHADMVGQQGDAPADQAAHTLLGEALQLQQQLHATDAQLCELVGVPCANLDNRKHELLGAAPAKPG